MTHRTRLAALAAKTRLPSLGRYGESVEAGDLMSYAPSLPDVVRRAATYVDKILEGGTQRTDLGYSINVDLSDHAAWARPPRAFGTVGAHVLGLETESPSVERLACRARGIAALMGVRTRANAGAPDVDRSLARTIREER